MSFNPPGRPPNLNDLTMGLNGSWQYLGKIVSAGVAINNATTATPFAYQPRGPGDAANGVFPNYAGTLAGRTIILQAMDNAFLALPSTPGQTLADMAANPVTQATGANPGLRYGAGERPSFVMGANAGWLQVVSESGTATVAVWELL